MNLSSGGYKILLLVFLLNHKLLEAERTFWGSITAYFPKCVPETLSQPRYYFALTSWSFLHVFEAQLTIHRRALEEIGFICVLSTVTQRAENNDRHTKKTLKFSFLHIETLSQSIILIFFFIILPMQAVMFIGFTRHDTKAILKF